MEKKSVPHVLEQQDSEQVFLEIYLNQLTIVDKEWEKKFRTTWLDIEVAYSLALDQGLDKPINDGDAIVMNSLTILNKMAKDKIENLKNRFYINENCVE